MKRVHEKVTVSAAESSDWIVLGDQSMGYGSEIIGVQLVPGSNTVKVEGTLNLEIREGSDTVPSDEIVDLTGLTGITTNTISRVEGPLKAIRLTCTTYSSGDSDMIVLVEGK